jgi:hypothetical protein
VSRRSGLFSLPPQRRVAAEPDTALLWVLRENLRLLGAQTEGAAMFGVSHALGERITFQNGVVQQSNFHDYPLLRMADVPDVHARVISTDNSPGGVGEAGLPPIAPALANAVAALTGARVRQLPMLPERVLAALKACARMSPARGLALLAAVVVLAVTMQPAPPEALEPTTMLLIAGAIMAVVLIVTVRDEQRGQVSLLLAHADPILETP